MKSLIKKMTTRENLMKVTIPLVLSLIMFVLVPEIPFVVKFAFKQIAKAMLTK